MKKKLASDFLDWIVIFLLGLEALCSLILQFEVSPLPKHKLKFFFAELLPSSLIPQILNFNIFISFEIIFLPR